ncbi:MAG: hypothetical protein IKX06_05240 [Clostridia bacterium]|nr:hypothetical protein [Clostridia bacterium]
MKKILLLFTVLAVAVTSLFGCTVTPVEPVPTVDPDTLDPFYTGDYSDTDGSYGGIDALGRTISLDGQVSSPRDKKVGIFYFLWHGQHGTDGPYNIYEIMQKDRTAAKSATNWKKAGGADIGVFHFWSQPMFGYYLATDQWVQRKHLQMLCDAGIDFMVFDATNAYTYTTPARKLIEVWYEYLEMGVDVPKLAFYTATDSGKTINQLYKDIYNNAALRKKYPRIDELWFYYDGKPLIIGVKADPDLSQECRDYFRIKERVWPNEDARPDDGFPWMEFSRNMTDLAVYGLEGRKEVVNVSIAQHDDSVMMSMTAFYGRNDRTRSWHDGANDTSENAMAYGYNVAEQWEWAISVDPEMVFFTGWNEWIAQRLDPGKDKYTPIKFCDCCDPNTSRDAEPVEGLYGDNYYMQLIDCIRKYKGTAARVNVGGNVTIDVGGSFDQWNSASVTARYTDYRNDTVDRDSKGYGTLKYKDKTGRNDFVTLKAARDEKNLYFYAETAEDITPSTDDNWMTLFINSGADGGALWENGFDFAVNLEKPDGGKAVVSKYNADGTWTKAGTAEMKVEGSKLMLSVSRELLGVASAERPLNVQFKWADNYQKNEDGSLNVYSFYKNGDAAPIGRLTYVFSEKNFKYAGDEPGERSGD